MKFRQTTLFLFVQLFKVIFISSFVQTAFLLFIFSNPSLSLQVHGVFAMNSYFLSFFFVGLISKTTMLKVWLLCVVDIDHSNVINLSNSMNFSNPMLWIRFLWVYYVLLVLGLWAFLTVHICFVLLLVCASRNSDIFFICGYVMTS